MGKNRINQDYIILLICQKFDGLGQGKDISRKTFKIKKMHL